MPSDQRHPTRARFYTSLGGIVCFGLCKAAPAVKGGFWPSKSCPPPFCRKGQGVKPGSPGPSSSIRVTPRTPGCLQTEPGRWASPGPNLPHSQHCVLSVAALTEHPTGDLKQQETVPLSLEAGGPKSQGQQGQAPSEGGGQGPCCLFQRPMEDGKPYIPLSHVPPSSLLIRAPVTESASTLLQ